MASQSTIELKTVVNQRQRAAERELRRVFFKRCREALEQLNNDVSGFAIVIWDKKGNLHSAYDVEPGPVGLALMPTLVSDALNRHVAAALEAKRIVRSSDT